MPQSHTVTLVFHPIDGMMIPPKTPCLVTDGCCMFDVQFRGDFKRASGFLAEPRFWAELPNFIRATRERDDHN